MPKKKFHHADDTERRLIKNMAKEGIPWKTIQRITGRSSDTLNNILYKSPQRKGAPIKFTRNDAKKVFAVAEKLVKKANAQKEVRLDTILEEAGFDISERTVWEHFRSMKVSFYKLKEKPLLEPEDIRKRHAWTNARKRRSKEGWKKQGLSDRHRRRGWSAGQEEL